MFTSKDVYWPILKNSKFYIVSILLPFTSFHLIKKTVLKKALGFLHTVSTYNTYNIHYITYYI